MQKFKDNLKIILRVLKVYKYNNRVQFFKKLKESTRNI